MSGKHLLLLFLGLVVLTTPSIARLLAPTIVSLDEGNEDLALQEENPPTIHVAPIDFTSFGPLPIHLQGEDQVSLSEVSKSAEELEPERKHKHKKPHHKEHHKPHAPPPPELAEAPESEHKHKHHQHKIHAPPPPPEVAEAPESEHKHHSRAPPPEFAEAPHAPPPEQDASDS